MNARARGYTAIEVMISLALLGVGAAGVISMQRGTIQGISHARNLDTANAIAHTWLERMRADATQWTKPNGGDADGNDFASARFLNRGGSNMTDAGWYLPDQAFATLGMSPAFDVLGRDLPYLTNPTTPSPTQPAVKFCTHVRIDCLVKTLVTAGAPTTCSLMRAQVRVFWPKDLVDTGNLAYCSAGAADAVADATNAPNYHFLYVVSAIRQNTVR